jgi:hypothetical protein
VDRRFAAFAAVCLVVIAAAGIKLLVMRPAPAPVEAPRSTEPAPAPPAPVEPRVEPPEPAPAPPVARRRPAPKPESAPAPETPAPAAAAPTSGTLRIESDVPGAQVFIDREYVGVTPVTANDVKPGTHRINLSAQGYEGFAETIEVAPGPRDLRVNFKEVRLDASIDVVHKHRIGSCKGRLVATQQGMRYETTNKDDGFSAALLDLGTFQVDYLEKNLKLTLKGGKQFNFTDPQGNADHLFVFHRDVEKARERLKKGDRPAQN